MSKSSRQRRMSILGKLDHTLFGPNPCADQTVGPDTPPCTMSKWSSLARIRITITTKLTGYVSPSVPLCEPRHHCSISTRASRSTILTSSHRPIREGYSYLGLSVASWCSTLALLFVPTKPTVIPTRAGRNSHKRLSTSLLEYEPTASSSLLGAGLPEPEWQKSTKRSIASYNLCIPVLWARIMALWVDRSLWTCPLNPFVADRIIYSSKTGTSRSAMIGLLRDTERRKSLTGA